jgi:esterase/lipase superfamily enzyme
MLLLCLSASLLAQRREIRGRVIDAAGAPVSGVTVEIRRGGTVEQTTTTGDDGEFRFDVDLARGSLEIRLPSVRGLEPTVVPVSRDTVTFSRSVGPLTVEGASERLATAAPPPPEREAPAIDQKNHTVVPVFFATDRKRVDATPSYGGEREPAQDLHLGRIDVSVPRAHEMGRVERPDIWTLWREDPARHLVIVHREEQSYSRFYNELGALVGRSRRKEAFVFIHGFNVTFDGAVYRTAQMAYDLGFDGAPVLYSWPSVGNAVSYATDANNSEWTINHLRWFLEDVAARSGAQYVHLIAHSRGNWPLMKALSAMASEVRATPRPRFRQIMLTAPDVDADVFRTLARSVASVGDRTTLYASANDEALKLSKRFQGYPRAGDVDPKIVVVDGIDSVDVSAVDTSFLGHSYYGDNVSVISDMVRLLTGGLPPDQRCGLRSLLEGPSRWWRFIAKSVCPI